jgi:hypothetical protein
MRWWPWSRRPETDTGEAEQARRQSEEKLAQTCRGEGEVREVAERLRELRRRNRFGDMIADSMRPRGER